MIDSAARAAAAFLFFVEHPGETGRSPGLPKEPQEWAEAEKLPGVEKLAGALRTLGGTIGDPIGSGSYGVAFAYDGERVVKLTTDETETKASAALVGIPLTRVVRIEGAYFVHDVHVTTHWSPDPVRVGVVVQERVQPVDEATRMVLRKLVFKYKDDHRVNPWNLARLSRERQRERLREASEGLSEMLAEESAKHPEPTRSAMFDVSVALGQLRSVGVYAIDAHGGNIGYAPDEDVYKMFDLGTSSPPNGSTPGELSSGATEAMEVPELGRGSMGTMARAPVAYEDCGCPHGGVTEAACPDAWDERVSKCFVALGSVDPVEDMKRAGTFLGNAKTGGMDPGVAAGIAYATLHHGHPHRAAMESPTAAPWHVIVRGTDVDAIEKAAGQRGERTGSGVRFAFHDDEKAAALAHKLTKAGYFVQYGPSASLRLAAEEMGQEKLCWNSIPGGSGGFFALADGGRYEIHPEGSGRSELWGLSFVFPDGRRSPNLGMLKTLDAAKRAAQVGYERPRSHENGVLPEHAPPGQLAAEEMKLGIAGEVKAEWYNVYRRNPPGTQPYASVIGCVKATWLVEADNKAKAEFGPDVFVRFAQTKRGNVPDPVGTAYEEDKAEMKLGIAGEAPGKPRILRWHRHDNGEAYEAKGALGGYMLVKRPPDRRHGILPWSLLLNGKEILGFDSKSDAQEYAQAYDDIVRHVGPEVTVDPKAGHALLKGARLIDGCTPWISLRKDENKLSACTARMGTIDSQEDVYRLLAPEMASLDQEIFVVVLLDVKRQGRGIAEIARGGRSRVVVEPSEAIRYVLVTGATTYYVAHCHPSGDPSPSSSDKRLTRAFEKATKVARDNHVLEDNVQFAGHVVIGHDAYADAETGKVHRVK